MLTKELAVPLALFTLSLTLKACSFIVLCSRYHIDIQKEADHEDIHDHEEEGIVIKCLRTKKNLKNRLV